MSFHDMASILTKQPSAKCSRHLMADKLVLKTEYYWDIYRILWMTSHSFFKYSKARLAEGQSFLGNKMEEVRWERRR